MPELHAEKALVLSARRLGERSWIVALFSKEAGRVSGVYSRKQPPEPASTVNARWQARLSEQLGRLSLEEITPVAVRYLDDKKRLACLASVCSLLNDFLPERQAFPGLYRETVSFLAMLAGPDFLKQYVLFEKKLLSETGFGLDLSGCAGGGDASDLAYISPKTGRAVSREKGEPYRNRLLPLPRFFWQDMPADGQDIRSGLKLTGYFLEKHSPKHRLPGVRTQL